MNADNNKNAYWAVQVTGAVLELVSNYSPASISLNECRILNSIVLSELEGKPVGVSDLSSTLNIPRPTVSRVVADFYADGALHENRHPEDGRKRQIRYTDLSNERMNQWSQALKDQLKGLFPEL